MSHTKGEWIVGSEMYDDGSIYILGGKDHEYICSVQIKQIGGGAIAAAMEGNRFDNARHICQCVNCHEELVEACEDGEMAIKNLCEYLAGRIVAPDSIKAKKAVGLIQAALAAAKKE